MPYFICPRCGQQLYSAATNTIDDRCPRCKAAIAMPAPGRDGPRAENGACSEPDLQGRFERYRDTVEALMAAEVPFGAVEATIEQAQLMPDTKAALWLLAWSLREQAEQVQDARATLRMLATR